MTDVNANDFTEVHASLVAHEGRGLLLRGPSGAGKSDLALRLVDRGFQLVADDRVRLRVAAGVVLGSPPAVLAGLIEVRGLGLFRLDHLAEAPVCLVVDLVAAPTMERLPAPRHDHVCGIALPVVAVAAFHASTPAALALALAGDPVAGALGDAA
jgi:HPr kinase/phosphorylase